MANRLVYFECDIEGHEDYLLNIVCLDNYCDKKGLICTMCQYYSHQNHVQKPLKVFLNEYKSVIMKVTKEIPQSMKAQGETPNPLKQQQSSQSQLNLKQCKQLYDSVIMKIEDYQVQVQEQFSSIYKILKSYYEEQVFQLKKMNEQQSKEQANGSSPQNIASEFVSQGKQIIESIERSIPAKPDEQRNLVSILADNIIVEEQGFMNWKNQNILQGANNNGVGIKKGGSNIQEKIEESIQIAEQNLQDVYRCLDSTCIKIDGYCLDIISQIATIKSEIVQCEMKDDLDTNINSQSKQSQNHTNNQLIKPTQQATDKINSSNNKIRAYLDSTQVKSNNADEKNKDVSTEDKFKQYLVSRKKDDQKEMDEEIQQSTSDLTQNKKIRDIENATTEKKDTSREKSPPSKPVVKRGYLQSLSSLNKLNKPAVPRANSDLSELFNSNDDNINNNIAMIYKKESPLLPTISENHSLNDSKNKVDLKKDEMRNVDQNMMNNNNKNNNSNNNNILNKNEQNQKLFNIDQKQSIQAHKSICKDITFIDEFRIATCSFDFLVKIWDTQSGSLIKELKSHSKRINCIIYSSMYNLLVSASDDCKAIAYKDLGADSWEEVLNLNNDSKVQSCVFFEQEDQLICGQEDGGVQIWSISSGQRIKKLDSCKEKLICLRIIKEKKFLLGCANNNIYIWKIQSSKIISNKKNAHKDSINDIIFLRHGGEDCFATAGDDKAIKIWSLKDYSVLMEFYEQDHISSLQFSTLLNKLVVSIWGENQNGYISFWNLADTQRVDLIRKKNDGITKIRYLNESNLLAVAIDNGFLEIYQLSLAKN